MVLINSVQSHIVTCKTVTWPYQLFKYEDMQCFHTKTYLSTVKL